MDGINSERYLVLISKVVLLNQNSMGICREMVKDFSASGERRVSDQWRASIIKTANKISLAQSIENLSTWKKIDLETTREEVDD